jgi:riboflavin kinase
MSGEGAKLQHLHALKHLALLGGLRAPVRISSGEFAEVLGLSQQAASALLLDLYRAGLIRREISSRRQHVTITDSGAAALAQEHAELHGVFEEASTIDIRGKVASGLGEGAYYMGQDGYQSQFEKLLGARQIAGTLNVKLAGGELAKLKVLENAKGMEVAGFTSAGRTFGGAKLFRCELEGVVGAVIMPLRTHHRDILEVISRKHYRRTLKLTDGASVHVRVKL